MLYKRRSIFRSAEERIGKMLAKTGASPNHLTALSILLSFAVFYSVIMHRFAEAMIIFAIVALLDAADGSLARATGKATKRGAYLDTIADRFAEFIVLFSLVFIGMPGIFMPHAAWIMLFMFGSLMTTYAKSAAKEKDIVKDELKGGILERAERMALIFIILALGIIGPLYMAFAVSAGAILSNITALQRIASALRK